MAREVDSAPTAAADLISQAAMDALPLAAGVLNSAGELLAVNELFRDLYAGSVWPRPLAAGTSYLTLTSRREHAGAPGALFITELCEVLRGGRDSTEHEMQWHGSTARWFEVRAARVAGDAHGRVMVTHRDITAQSAAQLRVAAFEATLQAAVAEHTAHLQHRIDDLESFGRAVSHALRNPLFAVESFSRLALDTTDLPHEVRENLGLILGSALQLSEMLDGLRVLSGVGDDETAWGIVDIAAQARETAAALAARDPRRTVAVKIAPLPILISDARLTRLVVQNLLENAWKYTAHTSEATIEVGCLASAHDRLTYYVRDNGVGFSAGDTASIFLPFKRLASARAFAAEGVGLATVKRAMDRLNGRVWADSTPGNGATLYFSLDPRPSGL
jgi:signal transduction histidine kinase